MSATPDLAPTEIARLLKGRLQHELRIAGTPCRFSRKVALRAIGENRRDAVEGYLRNQVKRSDLADARYREAFERLQYVNPAVDLKEPMATASGRYWYNLHLVLVAEGRYRMSSETAAKITAACRMPCVAKCAVMPDHLHLALRGDPAVSPEALARQMQAVTATAAGMLGFWKDTFYVGTFGEYDMGAVRRR